MLHIVTPRAHATPRQAGLPAPPHQPTVARQAGKMLVPLLGVLAVLSMAVAGAAVWLQMEEREKRQAKERELLLTIAERDELKGQLEQVQQARSRAEDELTRVRKELLTTQDHLSEAAASQEALTRAVEDRQKEVDRLAKDLQQREVERKGFAAQVADLTAERDEIQKRLADLEQAKEDLEAKLTELAEQPTVELDKVVVGGDPPASGGQVLPVSATSSIPGEGQIVVVNREYDFIVMNLGKKQGLSLGQEFQVVRGSEVLGKVKVEKIYDELSAAAILPESRKESIREGDTVKAL